MVGGGAGVELIIFDCDGVLIDSEVLSSEALIEELARGGLRVTPQDVRDHFLGRSFVTVAGIVRDRFGLSLPSDFEARYRQRLFEKFDAGLKPMPGIADLLASLAVPYCGATSSSPLRAARSLQIAGLARFFEGRLFTASEVPRGKPAPDLFLYAAERMGAPPEACLVVEDSSPGFQAARAAGMRVLAFTGGSHLRGVAFDSGAAEGSFSDWAAFPDLLKAFGRR